MIRTVRIILIVVFVLVLIWTGFLVVYRYTHDDVAAPVIVSDNTDENGNDILEVSVHATKEDLLQGLHAYDNVDGDISDRIMVRNISQLQNGKDALITYIVFDSASNYTFYGRTLRYTDYTSPKFSLAGPMVFNTGSEFTLLGQIHATDSIDGDISNVITLRSSTVMRNIAGNYSIEVSVKNRMGDQVDLPLSVIVTGINSKTPTIRLSDYLIYARRGTTPDFRRMITAATDPLGDENSHPDQVVINSSSYDPHTPGVYEIFYYYTSPISNETAVTILVVVVQ